MTIAERWVRDMYAEPGKGPAAVLERGAWTFYFSDGKERVSADDFPEVKAQIETEKLKPRVLDYEQLWGAI